MKDKIMRCSSHAGARYGLVLMFIACTYASSSPNTSSILPKKLVIGIDGGTESIRACCFDAITGQVVGKACASSYQTYHPNPGWAEQNPIIWWDCLGRSVRGAIDSLSGGNIGNSNDHDHDNYEICSICVDTTCCSVVALDEHKKPLRQCLLWMDARSASQTEQIMEKCKNNPALQVNCGGLGPISAEWMTPKALWIRQNEPHIWESAKIICEYQDYINYKLTGNIFASSCNASTRWHFDGEECLKASTPDNPYPGRPLSMWKELGIPELAEKLPQRCIPMGAFCGKLSEEASKHLNLPVGVPVTQGGPDAFVGMIGLGCINPGQLCLITGSSHLHCVVSSSPATAPGTWGAYKGAPLQGICFAEGGQSSTGSIIRWARNIFGENDKDYSELDKEASKIPPGCDGLVALETFQGSRTPVTDPNQRGAIIGLTLSHTRAHIWRALMESICFGTRSCLEGLENAGHICDEIIIAGGATRSDFWLQMHADVTGKPVVVCEFADAPLLGCAILASVNAGVHKTVKDAINCMVRKKKRILPSGEKFKTYDKLYSHVYTKLGTATRPISHAIAGIRGGHASATFSLDERKNENKKIKLKNQFKLPTISPSLLASDWSNIRKEIQRCLDAGLKRLHVDIFDGVFLDSPNALTFGPQMVEAIRSCSDETILDLHLCVDRPARYIQAMKEAGCNTFIFQWEAVTDSTDPLEAALEIARKVVTSEMDCGISINPSTSVEDIIPLLKSGLFTLVDVLAVEPGFGGQKFQLAVVKKIKRLYQFRKELINNRHHFLILVDGGMNEKTAPTVMNADILVAGTFIFKHDDLRDSITKIKNALNLKNLDRSE